MASKCYVSAADYRRYFASDEFRMLHIKCANPHCWAEVFVKGAFCRACRPPSDTDEPGPETASEARS